MEPQRPKVWRAVFVAAPGTGLEIDVGSGPRPFSPGEFEAYCLFLALRGVGQAAVEGPASPGTTAHLRRLLSLPGRPHATYHGELAAMFRKRKAELCARYAAYHVDGDRPPSNLGVALMVAIDDYARHPERWKYDPEKHPENAARRVWKAVKPLI
jgi:hypothetical protein